MLSILSPHLEGRVIMGGDSNITFDQLLDKSSHGRSRLKNPPTQSLRTARLLRDMGLIDVWRELNPTAKDYTYFSAPHNTYARIDHIFLPNSNIHTASHASIQEVPWSDHSLVTLLLLPLALWASTVAPK